MRIANRRPLLSSSPSWFCVLLSFKIETVLLDVATQRLCECNTTGFYLRFRLHGCVLLSSKVEIVLVNAVIHRGPLGLLQCQPTSSYLRLRLHSLVSFRSIKRLFFLS